MSKPYLKADKNVYPPVKLFFELIEVLLLHVEGTNPKTCGKDARYYARCYESGKSPAIESWKELKESRSMLSRYYYAGSLKPGNVELADSQAHHLIHVKRTRLGERVELFDGRGNAVQAEVIDLNKKTALLRIDSQPQLCEEAIPSPEVILASAVPKGDRFRWLIEKATEIGVTRFVPLITEHSVVSPRDSKLEKHRQYVIEACKQSRRNRLMEISDLQSLPEFCQKLSSKQSTVKSSQIFMGHPQENVTSLHQLQNILPHDVTSIFLIVGPEGGLTSQEYNLLEENNALPICCSSHILRTETAGLVLSSLMISAINTKLVSHDETAIG